VSIPSEVQAEIAENVLRQSLPSDTVVVSEEEFCNRSKGKTAPEFWAAVDGKDRYESYVSVGELTSFRYWAGRHSCFVDTAPFTDYAILELSDLMLHYARLVQESTQQRWRIVRTPVCCDVQNNRFRFKAYYALQRIQEG
jgi:hypothetical protein